MEDLGDDRVLSALIKTLIEKTEKGEIEWKERGGEYSGDWYESHYNSLKIILKPECFLWTVEVTDGISSGSSGIDSELGEAVKSKLKVGKHARRDSPK